MEYIDRIQSIQENIEKVIIGKRKVIKLLLSCLLSEGHALLEDVPGLGKTMLARSLALSIDSSFRRIQFTPDLLPTDVTGVSVFNMQTREFEFKPGPIFSHIVLADEINRASPRTQSALLECMEECRVSADGITYRLDRPFMVIATQNPIELAGTYPLPEAQLDRFMMKIPIGYPDHEQEERILTGQEIAHPIESLTPVASLDDVRGAIAEAKKVRMSPELKRYMVNVAQETRVDRDISLGVSPRGTLALMRTARAYAYLEGRDYVLPDDVKLVGIYVLSHRVHMNANILLEDKRPEEVIVSILQRVPVPVAPAR
jgi:MoxR-like ATPase